MAKKKDLYEASQDSSILLASASVIAGSSGLASRRRLFSRQIPRAITVERGRERSEIGMWAQRNYVSVSDFHACLPFRASSFQENAAITSSESPCRPNRFSCGVRIISYGIKPCHTMLDPDVELRGVSMKIHHVRDERISSEKVLPRSPTLQATVNQTPNTRLGDQHDMCSELR